MAKTRDNKLDHFIALVTKSVTEVAGDRFSAKEIAKLSKSLKRAVLLSELDISIAALGAQRKLNFVQVGANDGKSGDPIHRSVMRYGARALLIEPQPWLIERLRENYAEFTGELVVENVAIGPEPGTITLHVLKQDLWAEYRERVGREPDQIVSSNRGLVVPKIRKRLALDLDQAEASVERLDVPMVPLSALIVQYGFCDVDVLQIDCEGWDFQVIRSLGACRPAVINFESNKLSSEDWSGFVA